MPATIGAPVTSWIVLSVQRKPCVSHKYGASNTNDTVEVGWSVEGDGHFALRWREEGDPVVASPRKRGFGGRLIEQDLSHDLGGLVTLDFPSSGSCAQSVTLGRDWWKVKRHRAKHQRNHQAPST
jgi:hypothetical protein